MCRFILREAVSFYDESAEHYDRVVYEKVRKELIQTGLIQQNLFPCFEGQLKLLRQQIFDRFDQELRKHIRS